MKTGPLLMGLSVAMTAAAMESKPLEVGQPLPDVSLVTAEGKALSLRAEAKKQPLVLIFYRGGWCPYCNAHLGQLQEIDPQLRELGYRILAISPDRPKKLEASSEKGKLTYTLLSDPSMAAAKAFGLAFEVDGPMLEKLASYNIDIEEASGQNHHLLPVPAVFIVGRDGTVKFAHSNPDYTKRLEADKVLSAAKAATEDIRINGFDVSNASIPVKEILSGGPPRDGIPAIDKPRFIDPADVGFMQVDDQVVSLTVDDKTRAYPLRILAFHEIVNDEIAGKPVAVTYCPLCGTAMVFSRSIGERTLDFGVSGLLHQSDVLMYDRQTESLWSQLAMGSVAGPLVGKKLTWQPSEQMTWDAWKKKYPQGQVLSIETGFKRDYSRNVYAGYAENPGTMFPVPEHRTELPPKAWVAGIVVGDKAFAFPLKQLPPNKILKQKLDDFAIEVFYDPSIRQITVRKSLEGDAIPVVQVYWFAWQAFYPDTGLWKREETSLERGTEAQPGAVGR